MKAWIEPDDTANEGPYFAIEKFDENGKFLQGTYSRLTRPLSWYIEDFIPFDYGE